MMKIDSQGSGGLYNMAWNSTSKWISSHHALTNLGCKPDFSEVIFQNDASPRKGQTNHHYRQYCDLWLPSFSSSHAALSDFMDTGAQKSGWHWHTGLILQQWRWFYSVSALLPESICLQGITAHFLSRSSIPWGTCWSWPRVSRVVWEKQMGWDHQFSYHQNWWGTAAGSPSKQTCSILFKWPHV